MNNRKELSSNFKMTSRIFKLKQIN